MSQMSSHHHKYGLVEWLNGGFVDDSWYFVVPVVTEATRQLWQLQPGIRTGL